MIRNGTLRALLLGTLVALPALAQEYRGSLYLTVQTANGLPIVGAEVTISGIGAKKQESTNGRGEARFIKLEPGSYTIEVRKEGFGAQILTDVSINTSSNTSFDIRLQQSAFVEQVVVKARTPLMDQRKTGTSTVVNPAEINLIPTARDPWAVASTIPGVQTDSVNVGGSKSADQSWLIVKGDWGDGHSWVMDGVDITDMSAIGTPAMYFDFNSLHEIGYTTGGGALEQSTPGMQIAFTTKQGTNRHTGSLGLLLADQEFQDTPSEPVQPDGSRVESNRISQTFENVFDIGGPITSDTAWYWVGFSQNNVDLLVPGDQETMQSDRAELQNISVKVNAALGNTSLKTFYTDSSKVKVGRGAGVSRPPATTWNQDSLRDRPWPSLFTFEVSHFFNADLEISAQYGHVGGGFELVPQGTAPQIRLDANGVWQDTFFDYRTERPQHNYAVRGNWFTETGSLSHEIKFGFKYKDVEIHSHIGFGTQDVYAAEAYGEAWLMREGNMALGMEYATAWLGDTILLGNWTFNLGAAYTRSSGRQLPSTSRANGLCPTCLPEVAFPGFDPGFTFEDVLPRAGLTYSFGGPRRQLLRASVGRYVSPLSWWDVGFNHPMGEAEIDYLWNDLDGDKLVDIGEFDAGLPDPVTGVNCVFDPATGAGPTWSSNVDPCNPRQAMTPVDSIDPNYEAPRIDEAILGYELELAKDFTLALNYTHRRRHRDYWYAPLRDLVNGGIIHSSYWVPAEPVSGSVDCYDHTGPCGVPQGDSFTIQPWVLSDLAVLGPDGLPDTGDELTSPARPKILTNRPGYAEKFDGLELVATKRLSDRWMLRGFLAWQDWRQDLTCSATGPTGLCVEGPGIQNPANVVWGSKESGGALGHQNVGSALWHYNVNGLYQLPKNFTISANLQGRQGYVIPVRGQVPVRASDGVIDWQNLLVLESDRYRKGDLHTLDLRLSHLVQFEGGTTLDLSAEVFNVTNENTILKVSPYRGWWNGSQWRSATLGRISEVLSPRIVRLGARVTFR